MCLVRNIIIRIIYSNENKLIVYLMKQNAFINNAKVNKKTNYTHRDRITFSQGLSIYPQPRI